MVQKVQHFVDAINPLAMELSFRDQCAIAAMQGLIARGCSEEKSFISLMALNLADAMEAERVKRSEK